MKFAHIVPAALIVLGITVLETKATLADYSFPVTHSNAVICPDDRGRD